VKRLVAILPIVAFAALIVVFLTKSLHRSPQVTPMATVGKPAPALSLPALKGGAPVAIRDAARGPALVNFYASWCAPCIEEAPALMALKAEGVKIVGVAYKDSPDKSAAFLARLGDPYATVLVDADGRAGVEFGATGVPETYAIDAAGMIRAKHAGPITAADAEDLLAAASR
jgi:cytochrome c biogenesis protein CcmG/thiol:disulfide interchange protein DsbE